MNRFAHSLLFAIAFLVAFQANSAVTVSVLQAGSNVVATSSGTINTGACSSLTNGFFSQTSGIAPSTRTLAFGPVGSNQTECATNITVSSPFGSGGLTSSSANSGASFFISPSGFWGPAAFTSTTSFSGSQTYSNTTLAAMGLTLGTYTFTLTNGGTSDTLIVKVSAPDPIPTMSEWAMILMAGLMGIFAFMRLRKS